MSTYLTKKVGACHLQQRYKWRENVMLQEHSRYYFKLLKVSEKKIYETIYDTWYLLKKNVDLKESEVLGCDIQKIMEYLFLDNPELFYINKEHIQIFRFIFGSRITCEFYWNVAEIQFKRKEIETEAKKIVKRHNKVSKQEEFKVIHDSLVNTIKYNWDEIADLNNYGIYGCICKRKAVCEGIAKGYKFLCDREKLSSIVVPGTIKNGNRVIENHAWNIINYDGKRRHVDVTWDVSIKESGYTQLFFGLNDKEMVYDHQWDEKIIPSCEGKESKFRFVTSSKSLEVEIVSALRHGMKQIFLRFNRKFSSETDILHFVEKSITKNGLWPLNGGQISVNYMRTSDCAIVFFKHF